MTPAGPKGDTSPVFIGSYASPGDPAPSVTRPLDASDLSGLPRLTAELFVAAGATVARHDVDAGAHLGDVKAALRRAAEQASRLVQVTSSHGTSFDVTSPRLERDRSMPMAVVRVGLVRVVVGEPHVLVQVRVGLRREYLTVVVVVVVLVVVVGVVVLLVMLSVVL